ncbi:restriction endonuclease [Campylobacter jejuni]|nr:restriction endonuclease [Campylobacter jejuni]EAI3983875.1 restriction endonuclease [Campylobacter jejuni]EAK0278244.1 restriction endonuclease [Campylobacter jejuni]
MDHEFTKEIKKILKTHFGDIADEIYEKSYLLQYLNHKTKSANRGSKSRGSFANLYAIYVLVKDYIDQGYLKNPLSYTDYDGAMYSTLLQRMRGLPFGQKIQNHALNNRMNDEFKKFFPYINYQPIIRDFITKKYWINDNLLKIDISGKIYNIANSVIEIIDAYVYAKKIAFERFLEYTINLAKISENSTTEAIKFIQQQIQPNVDARVFEIVSYSILKAHYANTILYWGYVPEELNEETLTLYKTGRTNANDGGIDFVMKPLGRFFQVTETLDFKKYFLDIDKIQRYPITFVIKTEIDEENIYTQLKENALSTYGVKAIVQRYMNSIEEVINIPKLMQIFLNQIERKKVKEIMDEIVIQSRVEFNYDD